MCWFGVNMYLLIGNLAAACSESRNNAAFTVYMHLTVRIVKCLLRTVNKCTCL